MAIGHAAARLVGAPAALPAAWRALGAPWSGERGAAWGLLPTGRMTCALRFTFVALALAAGACGSKQTEDSAPTTAQTSERPQPLPETTPPAGGSACGVAGAPETKEQCECLGGTARPDPGDGTVHCAENEKELGKIKLGIEGALCCAPAQAAP